MPTLNTAAEADLIWLSPGETATIEHFDQAHVDPPPHPNPDPYWTLEDAAVHVFEAIRDHDKLPWIRTQGRILDLGEIRQVYGGIRAMRLHDAHRT